jgi:hypothetical protein
MNFEFKKQILITLAICIVTFGIVYLALQFLPLYESPAIQDKNIASFDLAKQKCEALCVLQGGEIDYSNGPCLSDEYTYNVNGWACDIVNNPRIELDDDKKNQCKSILNNDVNYFIELDANCNFVRTNFQQQ